MVDAALTILKEVVKCFLKLRKAVNTVHQNEDDSRKIGRLLEGWCEILLPLCERPQVMNDRGIRRAVENLRESFRVAQEDGRKKRNRLRVLLNAPDRAEKLARMLVDIERNMVAVSLALNAYMVSILHDLAESIHAQNLFFATILGLSQQFWLLQKVGSCVVQLFAAFRALLPQDREEDARYTRSDENVEKNKMPAELRNYSLSELTNATENFEIIIAKRLSCTIYKGELDKEAVAIKKFHYPDVCFIDGQIELVSKLQHANIIKHLGYFKGIINEDSLVSSECNASRAVRSRHSLFVSEYMVESLITIIDGSLPIEWPSHLLIIQGIAHGVHYLHEKSIVHLDLKPSNILLDKDLTPKINDFRTAKAFGSDEITLDSNHLPGTEGYMAPEQTAKCQASTKSDVFSFGVILLEIISRICTEKVRPKGLNEWFNWVHGSELSGLFDKKLVADQYEMKVAINCLIVGLRCCASYPECRPSMAEVVDMLSATQ